MITGNEAALADALATQRNFFQRFLDRRLPGVERVIAYPTYQSATCSCCHGHYLDAHMTGSLADRLLTGAIWQVAGGRPADALTTEDYEAIIVPLDRAPLHRGRAASRDGGRAAVLHQLRRLGKLIELAGAPGRELRRLRSRIPMRSGAPLADGGIARPCSVIDPPSNALRAYGQVVRNSAGTSSRRR